MTVKELIKKMEYQFELENIHIINQEEGIAFFSGQLSNYKKATNCKELKNETDRMNVTSYIMHNASSLFIFTDEMWKY